MDASHQALTRFLMRLQQHSVLSLAEQQAIMRLKSETKQFGHGRDFVHPGDRTEHATLVAEGNVGRFDLMRDGARQITAIYIPGDMCDLHSVAAPITGWGLTSLTISTILQVSHSDLEEVARAYPNLAMAFWRDTVLDASILAKWIANVGRRDARARVAHLLCELGIRMERSGLGRRDDYVFALTQEHIGDAMGLTSVHVNRTLMNLKKSGAVSVSGRRVSIADWDELAAIADFSPTFLLCDEVAAQERERIAS